jgi:hypothetical protein
MRNHKVIGNVEPPRLEKGDGVLDNGTYVRLEVGRSQARVQSRRAPDLHREDVKGTKQSTRVVDGKDGRQRIPALFECPDDIRTTGNGGKRCHWTDP